MVYGYRKKNKKSIKRRKRARTATGKKNKNMFPFSRQSPNTVLSRSTLNRPMFGDTYSTKLVFAERGYSIQSSLGVPEGHLFSANGLFDPDISSITGHQPGGFDQIMQFYDHYTVSSAKIYVDFHNSDPNLYALIGILTTDGPSTPADYRIIEENGKGQVARLNKANVTGDICSLQSYVDIASFIGCNDVLDRDELRGTNVTNPEEQVYFSVWTAPISFTTALAVGFVVRVEYQVTFTEPKNVALS